MVEVRVSANVVEEEEMWPNAPRRHRVIHQTSVNFEPPPLLHHHPWDLNLRTGGRPGLGLHCGLGERKVINLGRHKSYSGGPVNGLIELCQDLVVILVQSHAKHPGTRSSYPKFKFW